MPAPASTVPSGASDSPVPRTGWGVVRRMLVRRRRRLTGFCALLCVWQLCETLVPVLIGVTIDRGVATGDPLAFAFWAAMVVLLFVVLSYGYRFGARLGLRAMETETHDLRVEIATHALDPHGVRSGATSGETLSLATSDAEEVGYALRMLGYGVASAVALVVAAVFLLRTDVVLGLVVLAGVPVCLGITQLVTPAVSRRSRLQQERTARSAGVAVDLVRGLRVLHGVGGERAAVARYRVASGEARDAGVRVAGARAVLVGLAQGLSGIFLAVVTLLAGRLALQGEISVGELIAIVGLAQFLAEPIAILAELSAQLASSLASGRRIAEYLATPTLAASASGGPGPAVASGGPAIAVNRPALASPSGELLGVVVTDPEAAQRLVQALAGEVTTAESGVEVALDGVPAGHLDIDARRAALVVAPHRADLMEGTLRSNIDPWSRCDEQALARAVAASAADDVADLREGGLDEPVTPDGATYSGGQRQRIAMARALASGAPVLVLHDPTTAVDSVTEGRIAQGLRSLRGDGGLTTWVVTSSPALLEQADRVVLVGGAGEAAEVVAEGTHHDLLADPAYRAAVLR